MSPEVPTATSFGPHENGAFAPSKSCFHAAATASRPRVFALAAPEDGFLGKQGGERGVVAVGHRLRERSLGGAYLFGKRFVRWRVCRVRYHSAAGNES